MSKHELSVFRSDEWISSSNIIENGFEDIVAVTVIKGKPILRAARRFGKNQWVGDELIYDESNSSLRKRTEYEDWIEGDIQFDNKGNLWCTNSQTAKPLSVLYTNGVWQSFSIGAGFQSTKICQLLIDKNNQKWVLLKNDGLVVFDETRQGTSSRN